MTAPRILAGALQARVARAVLAVALLSLGCHHLPSAPPSLWSVADPRGDDHGDGDLTYPLRGEPAAGELDLVELRAFRARGGAELEAVFSASIRRPDGRLQEATGQTLDEVAKLGFYTLNIDVYVDVDRAPGSGRLDMLPGRKAQVSPDAAWDKAIVVTPRPHLAHDRLTAIWASEEKEARIAQKRSMSTAEEAALQSAATAEVDRLVHFATRVTVATNTIRFFVPESFLPGGADAEHAYTVVVTGADLSNRVDVGRLLGRDSTVSGIAVVGIAPGKQRELFGGGRVNDPEQPPIVDLLVPINGVQEEALRTRPAVLPSVVPSRITASK